MGSALSSARGWLTLYGRQVQASGERGGRLVGRVERRRRPTFTADIDQRIRDRMAGGIVGNDLHTCSTSGDRPEPSVDTDLPSRCRRQSQVRPGVRAASCAKAVAGIRLVAVREGRSGDADLEALRRVRRLVPNRQPS